MLTEIEKMEMLEDGMSIARREQFKEADRMARALLPDDTERSLDSYIDFLQGIQEIFGPFPVSTKSTSYKICLL